MRKEEGLALIISPLPTSPSVLLSLARSFPAALSPGLTDRSSQRYLNFYHLPHSFVDLPLYLASRSVTHLIKCRVCSKPTANAGVPLYKVLTRPVDRLTFLDVLFIISLLNSGTCSVAFLSTGVRGPLQFYPPQV